MDHKDPPFDLNRERDELLTSYRRGTQLTQELLAAYETLGARVEQLERENEALLASGARGGAAVSPPDARVSAPPPSKSQVAQAAQDELELELATYASLHVASNCLHSTLNPRGVGRRIKEILEQLIGVESYGIFLGWPVPAPVVFEGLRSDDKPADAPLERCLEVMQSGKSQIGDEADPSQGTMTQPFALLPLCIDDKVVGVLVIIRSLPHKTQLSTVDFELFKLLGQHAAAALMAAGLYAEAGRQLPNAGAFSSLQP